MGFTRCMCTCIALSAFHLTGYYKAQSIQLFVYLYLCDCCRDDTTCGTLSGRGHAFCFPCKHPVAGNTNIPCACYAQTLCTSSRAERALRAPASVSVSFDCSKEMKLIKADGSGTTVLVRGSARWSDVVSYSPSDVGTSTKQPSGRWMSQRLTVSSAFFIMNTTISAVREYMLFDVRNNITIETCVDVMLHMKHMSNCVAHYLTWRAGEMVVCIAFVDLLWLLMNFLISFPTHFLLVTSKMSSPQ